jgi:hypothetical protein
MQHGGMTGLKGIRVDPKLDRISKNEMKQQLVDKA